MIEDKKQYDITVAMLRRFETTRAAMDVAATPDIDPVLVEAIKDGQDETIKDLRAEVVQFEQAQETS